MDLKHKEKEKQILKSIDQYQAQHNTSKLIGISEIAQYCNVLEGELYVVLLKMQLANKLKIIKKYFKFKNDQLIAVYIFFFNNEYSELK